MSDNISRGRQKLSVEHFDVYYAIIFNLIKAHGYIGFIFQKQLKTNKYWYTDILSNTWFISYYCLKWGITYKVSVF